MKDFQDFFKMGMARDIPALIPHPQGLVLNIGAGNKQIPGTQVLDWPQWNAETDPIPHFDGTVDGIYAFHFLEHLHNPVAFLADCQRVLKPGGVMNICVPYYNSNMAHQDLDHKSWFTENTWQNTFNNPYYDKTSKFVEWEFDIGFNIIVGIVERNTCLLTQLLKRK